MDMTFDVAEKFVSINGEGPKAGQAAVFIRLSGCNLRCSYCDTSWAWEPQGMAETDEEIVSYIKRTEIKNVTLTGGEPLAAANADRLISRLCGEGFQVEIETNGSIAIAPFASAATRPSFTVDYKLPSSGMEGQMLTENFRLLDFRDSVKFVSGDERDLERALEIINEYKLNEQCRVFISPVYGKMPPVKIAEFIIGNKLNGVNLQLQLHKIIWDPEKRGV